MNRKQGRYASIRFLNALGAITCAYGSDSTADPSPCQPFRYVSCTQISFVRATDDRAALSFRTSFSYLRVRCELSPSGKNMRQLKGKTKETNKQKKERKKEFLENKQRVFTIVLPTVAAIFVIIAAYIYVKTRPKLVEY